MKNGNKLRTGCPFAPVMLQKPNGATQRFLLGRMQLARCT